MGLFNVSTTKNLVSGTDDIAETYLTSISRILNADRDLYQALVAQMSYVDARTNSEDGSRFLSAFEENADQAKERFETTVKQLENTGVSEIAAGFDTAYASWHQSAREALSLAKKTNKKQPESWQRLRLPSASTPCVIILMTWVLTRTPRPRNACSVYLLKAKAALSQYW
ncbi:hypothetical protein [Marinobacter sp. BSs20148]|uniref:hypothetical protein n=1 Tax=Marinobacter sp. BSs20148 TaxID=490759 RepID=UPI002227BF3F|nr:hypothetical protein [Marinobacter sp. BSs20148]